MTPKRIVLADTQPKGLLGIYVAEIEDTIDVDSVLRLYPQERGMEILKCKNERVRKEKYSAWQLLSFAVRDLLGRKMTEFDFSKTDNGKWESDGFYFSISHSNDAAAVAVSDKPVGVDIELLERVTAQPLQNKILTVSERKIFEQLPDGEKQAFLVEKWAQKESVFKRGGEGTFVPSRIEPQEVQSKALEISDKTYFVSASSEYFK